MNDKIKQTQPIDDDSHHDMAKNAGVVRLIIEITWIFISTTLLYRTVKEGVETEFGIGSILLTAFLPIVIFYQFKKVLDPNFRKFITSNELYCKYKNYENYKTKVVN